MKKRFSLFIFLGILMATGVAEAKVCKLIIGTVYQRPKMTLLRTTYSLTCSGSSRRLWSVDGEIESSLETIERVRLDEGVSLTSCQVTGSFEMSKQRFAQMQNCFFQD